MLASALAWLWYIAADATCVGGYLLSLRLEPSSWLMLSGWWACSLALPALPLPALLPRSALASLVALCVAVPPLLLQDPALRFIYGMAAAFRALRLLTLLQSRGGKLQWARVSLTVSDLPQTRHQPQQQQSQGVLRAAVLWGYHDVRTLQATSEGACQGTIRCLAACTRHAALALSTHLLLPSVHAKQYAASGPRTLGWAAVRLTLGTARLLGGMGTLSGAAECHLPALHLRPPRPALGSPFQSKSVADFWRSRWNIPVQELLHATGRRLFSGEADRGRRRQCVWVLSGLLHIFGLSLLRPTSGSTATVAASALSVRARGVSGLSLAAFFALQPCLIAAERRWQNICSGVWWTRLAVLSSVQLAVLPSLILTGR